MNNGILESKRPKKKRPALRAIIIVVLSIIAVYAGTVITLDHTSNSASQQYVYAIERHDYPLALRELKRSNIFDKMGFLWIGYTPNPRDTMLLEGVVALDEQKILTAIDKRLENGHSAERVWDDWNGMIGGKIIENNYYGSIKGWHTIQLEEVYPLLPIHVSIREKLTPVAVNSILSPKIWSYRSENDLTSIIGTSPAGKVLICFTHEDELPPSSINGIDFGLTSLLPKHFMPASLAEVEYIVFFRRFEGRSPMEQITRDSSGQITSRSSVFGEERSEIILFSANEMSTVMQYGTCSSSEYEHYVMEIVSDLENGILADPGSFLWRDPSILPEIPLEDWQLQ